MIGLFDSGFGGLHVLRGIVKRLPGYGYLYLGDSARAPYGPRASDEVYSFTKQGVEFLFAHGAKLVVLACNTASSEALRKIQQEYLREGSPKKVLGVLIPFAEAAAARTRTKRVGVMATEGTVRSGAFPREITKVNDTIQVFQQACPLLVPLVERGEQNSAKADTLIRGYLAPLLGKHIDALVLGCTHYGILKRHPELEMRIKKSGEAHFYCTGNKKHFEKLGSVFFEKALEAERVNLGTQEV
jgi:glutamate racemase